MPTRLLSAALRSGALALTLWSAACASSGVPAPKPFPMPEPRMARGPVPRVSRPTPADAPDPLPTPNGLAVDAVLRTALSLRGTPYRNGGSDPQGFDCSGFTQWVFAQSGWTLPRETREQYRVGAPISRGQVQPGDLVFFTTTARGASHVGIALGGDSFVHAPSSKGVVRVESMSLPYWDKRFVGVWSLVVSR